MDTGPRTIDVVAGIAVSMTARRKRTSHDGILIFLKKHFIQYSLKSSTLLLILTYSHFFLPGKGSPSFSIGLTLIIFLIGIRRLMHVEIIINLNL